MRERSVEPEAANAAVVPLITLWTTSVYLASRVAGHWYRQRCGSKKRYGAVTEVSHTAVDRERDSSSESYSCVTLVQTKFKHTHRTW